MFILMDKKIITILRKLFLLNWPHGYKCIYCHVSVRFAVFSEHGSEDIETLSNGLAFITSVSELRFLCS